MMVVKILQPSNACVGRKSTSVGQSGRCHWDVRCVWAYVRREVATQPIITRDAIRVMRDRKTRK